MDMKKLAGDKAAEYVKDGMVVGLGTGSTAYHMVNAVGEMVKNGLKIQAIPTSKATEAQARELGIPLLTIDELDHVDLAIDGVDAVQRHQGRRRCAVPREGRCIHGEGSYLDHGRVQAGRQDRRFPSAG